MNLIAGESYLPGLNITKVFVAVEDQSVWALTNDGKVYYKTVADVDFQIYPKTSSLIIKDITGFNVDEMFFLVTPNIIYHYKGGTTYQIPVQLSGVTLVNNIAAIHGKINSSYYDQQSLLNRDWVAVATNKHLYKIFRGESEVTEQYPYQIPSVYNEPDWRITHSSFKSADFRYRNAGGWCRDLDYKFLNNVQNYHYDNQSEIPSGGDYPSKINCSLFAYQINTPFSLGNGVTYGCNLWGTDVGLFIKDQNNCTGVPKHVLTNQVVNDLAELYALTPIFKQNFAFAATNNGLYYTNSSIFNANNGNLNVNNINFSAIPLYNGVKINSLSAETKEKESYEMSGGMVYTSMCETVLWCGTVDGVKKTYSVLDQNYYEALPFSDFTYSRHPGSFSTPSFDLCGEYPVTITYRIPEVFESQILIQWYKDDIEQTQWIGKRSVDINSEGVYRTKVTSLCEGIFRLSIPIIIKDGVRPDITFNYPDEINLCENEQFTLITITKPGYTFRWFRNDVQILSANNNSYTVSQSGNYRVEVSNCPGSFESSSIARVKVNSLETPVILSDKMVYCEGIAARLSLNNNSSHKVKWYLEGNELINFAGQNQITVTNQGNYMAVFENVVGCVKNSAVFNYETFVMPPVSLIRSSERTLCFGESVRLSTNQISGATYLWNNGETTSDIVVSVSGIYRVVTTINECSGQSMAEEVNVNKKLELSKFPDTTICTFNNQSIKLEAPKGYSFYSWNGEKSTESKYTVTKTGNYELVVEDRYGCTVRSTFIVSPWCKELIIPNTFTPNNDGANDMWEIGGLEKDSSTEIVVYNRYGAEIYRSNGIYKPWDGKYKGEEVATGTYYYIIKSKLSPSILKGSITIFR